MPLQQFNAIKDHDLGVLVQPYLILIAIVALLLFAIVLVKLPETTTLRIKQNTADRLHALLRQDNYREGVICEFCYTGAQTMCWINIIPYAQRICTSEGMTEQMADATAQQYSLIAISCFVAGRFLCTWLLRWFNASRMLSTLAITGMVAFLGALLFTDRSGLYCLIAASGCLSMMFPTIYGLALHDVHEHVKIGAAGLTMSVLGGSFFPLLQVIIINSGITLLGVPSINASFVLPFLCMVMVTWYAHRTYVRYQITSRPEEEESVDSGFFDNNTKLMPIE